MYKNSRFSLPLQHLVHTISRILYFLYPLSGTFFTVDCSLTYFRLLEVFFSVQPSFSVILKIALGAPPQPPTNTTISLTSLIFPENLYTCQFVYPLSPSSELWSPLYLVIFALFSICLKRMGILILLGGLFHKVKRYSCIPCLCKHSWLTVGS